MIKHALCWLRRDLRVSDHAALAEACSIAERVTVVFVFDRQILDALTDRSDRRLSFIHRSLLEVDEALRQRGSSLVVLHGDPADEIPALAARLGVQAVVAARDYEPYALARDSRVSRALGTAGRELRLVKDTVIFEPEELATQGGGPFRVYSPYARAWRAKFVAHRDAADHSPDLAHLIPASLLTEPALKPLDSYGFQPAELWLEPGEAAAKEKLGQFVPKMSRYGEARNTPAAHGTSGLSVHLRFGTISVRKCMRQILQNPSAGAQVWENELIWRDFYQAVLFHHPHAASQPFQEQYKNLVYPGADSHFAAWCQGQTGYPLVDAAMRCLNQTGFMHNRLRMVVASFLTKDLLVDYRRGEAYFAEKLLDFDLASNNGGWQWAASTGTDPQPYFRIFNPISQSEKFDPDGAFIRQYVPELAALETGDLHFPPSASPMQLAMAGVELGVTYPVPLVDHAEQRGRAIELLRALKE